MLERSGPEADDDRDEELPREEQSMPSHVIGDTVIVHKDDFAYISHPSIVGLHSGDWLAAYNHSRRRTPHMHPPSDPLFRTLLSRSSDQGATWQRPVFAPDLDSYGTECPGIAQQADGTVTLTEFRFGWYPLPLARRLKAEGRRIAISLPGKSWSEDFGEDAWEQSQFTWARGYHGVYAHLSRDGGHLFEETVTVDCAPYRDGYSRTGVIELTDGRLAYALTEHHPPHNRYTFVVFSSDKGETWGKPTLAVDDRELRFGEPDLAEVAPGEIYCILRASRVGRHMFACRSTDAGETWSEAEPTSICGFPGHLLVLADGRLLCTYGCRWEPFGVRMALSADGGRSWDTEHEIVVRADLPNGDLGYPTTIEYAPGKLFCCYYGQEADGVTCVQGTYVDLP